jgi:hypothetical protein
MKCAKALCTLSLSHEFLTHRLISPVHSVFVYDTNCQIIILLLFVGPVDKVYNGFCVDLQVTSYVSNLQQTCICLCSCLTNICTSQTRNF